MSKCRNCQYVQISEYKIKGKDVEMGCCELTRAVVNPDVENDCICFNRDLSGFDICYNCRHYIGGGDWGLFCSNKDMYHHLVKFNDKACERF